MVTKILRKFTAIFDRTIDILFVLAGVVIVCQMVSVAGSTLMSYFLKISMPWVIAFSEFGILYIVFLSTAWLLKHERHVKMDIVVRRLSPRNQSVFVIITSIIGIGICLILTVYGIQVTWDHWVRGLYDIFKLIGFPKAIALVIIPIGSFLLTIQFARRAYGALRAEGVLKPRIEIDTENL